ncbi:MAG: ParA family protein [Synergistaceae bacterium]|nr:ParA family protein [Synergistaceae bacterium]
MSEIAVAVFNRKGGVGKTTIAVILAEIALVRGKSVLAIDLDPSRNFSTALNFLKESSFRDTLRVNFSLEDSDADAPEEWIVIDCPPALNPKDPDDPSKHAIDFADITVIPVRPDYFSLTPLGLIDSLAEDKYGKSRSQLPLVKLAFDSSLMSKVANQVIAESGHPVAEDIALHKSIPYNITSGKIWSMGLAARYRLPYESLYLKVENAMNRLQNGLTDVYEVWTSGGDAE